MCSERIGPVRLRRPSGSAEGRPPPFATQGAAPRPRERPPANPHPPTAATARTTRSAGTSKSRAGVPTGPLTNA